MPQIRSRSSRPVACTLLACALVAALAGTAHAQTKVRLLVKQGDPAPGGGTFSGTFGVTLAGPEGTAVFDGIGNDQRGIWMSDGTTTTKIVQAGDPVPPGVPGTVYGDQPGFTLFGLFNADDLGNVVFGYTSSRVLHTPGGTSVLPSDTDSYSFALNSGRIAIQRYVTSVGHYVSRGPVGGPYEEFYTHGMTMAGIPHGYETAVNFGVSGLMLSPNGTVPANVAIRNSVGNGVLGSYLFSSGSSPFLMFFAPFPPYPGSPYDVLTPRAIQPSILNRAGTESATSMDLWNPTPTRTAVVYRNSTIVFEFPEDAEPFLPPGWTLPTSNNLPIQLMMSDDGTIVCSIMTSESRPLLVAINGDGSISNIAQIGAPFPTDPSYTIHRVDFIEADLAENRAIVTVEGRNPGFTYGYFLWSRDAGLQPIITQTGNIVDADTGEVFQIADVTLHGSSFASGPGTPTSVGKTSKLFARLALRRTVPPFDVFGAVGMFDLNDLDPPCLSDVNGDTESDILDFLDFIDSFGTCENQPAPCAGSSGIEADFNGDTSVDILDFLDFFDAFGTGC